MEIGTTVARWLKNPDLLQKMKDNALRAARPRASYDIAREIADMLFLEEGEGEGEGGDGDLGFVDLAEEVAELDGFERANGGVMEVA